MNYNEKDELQGPQAPPRKKYLLQAGASKRDAMPGHTNHNGKRTVVPWVLMTPIRKTMGEECCCCLGNHLSKKCLLGCLGCFFNVSNSANFPLLVHGKCMHAFGK